MPFHDNFNNLSNRVQMKICASKNSVDPSTVAAAGTSTSGQAGPYTSTPYPTFGTRHAEVDIRSFGTTTLTSTTNRQPTSAGKHVAFKIRGGSDGDRLRFEEIKHILGASNLTDGAYNSSGLSDDSGNPLTIANNASGDDGWIIVGLGTRTGASGYTEGLAILEPTPGGTAPTSIEQTDELYLESRLTTGLVSEMCVVREIQASDTNQCPTGYTLATNAEIRRWPSCRHSSSATTVRTYRQGTFQWFYLHGADYQTYYDLTAGAQGASKRLCNGPPRLKTQQTRRGLLSIRYYTQTIITNSARTIFVGKGATLPITVLRQCFHKCRLKVCPVTRFVESSNLV